MYDIIVVGGGPAGLTAALYALRNGKNTLVIEKNVFGGQIVNSPKVENIPGFVSISGDEFADAFVNQVMEQGGKLTFDEVKELEKKEDYFVVSTEGGECLEAKAVILALGTTHRLLGLSEEENYIGNGISFCAVCDGDFYRDKKVIMIGGGNSALVEADLLCDIVKELVILQDLPYFTGEEKTRERVLANPKVKALTSCKVTGYLNKDGQLSGVSYLKDGKEEKEECDGVFLAIGLVPDNKAFSNLAKLDERGYFIADESGLTATAGLFVAGDCRNKSLRQVSTACGDGANAAIQACTYLNKL